jgi:hypothetical protein
VLRRLAVLALCALVVPASAAQAWTWPVDGPVLRPFSFDRAHPYAAGQHRGVDLRAETGTAVLAPAAGVVSFAGTVPTGGKTVSIETPLGYTATLVHLGSVEVVRGAHVGEGAVVGTVGPSGVVDLADPFVYFGLRRTGDDQGYVDPLSFLPARPSSAPPAPQVQAAAESAAPTAPAAEVPVHSASQPVPFEQPASAADPASVREANATPSRVDLRPSSASRPVLTEAAGLTVGHSGMAAARAAARPPVAGAGLVNSKHVHRFAHRDARVISPRHAVLPNAVEHSERSDALRNPPVDARPMWKARGGSKVPTWFVGGLVVFAALCLALMRARAVCRNRPPIMLPVEWESSSVGAGATAHAQGPGGTGMAVCLGEASSGPRRRVRRAGGHLRALPPVEGQRCPDGEWDGRARDARDGDGRSRRRLAA